MTRNLKLLLCFLLVTSLGAVAEPGGGAASGGNTLESPVAQARNARLWEMGPFVYWGAGIGNRSQYKFFAPGFEIGRAVTPVLHAGILSGQFALAGNIQPFWQAYTPKPHNQLYQCIEPGGTPFPCYLPVGGGTFTGFSFTPVIFRWNFLTHSQRFQPWFQGAGGLIYTTHKYPPDVLLPHGLAGGTSVWNFSPQGGIGVHWFTRRKRSVDLALNAVHISSASLGDRNPGVNASLQIQVGYTWWK